MCEATGAEKAGHTSGEVVLGTVTKEAGPAAAKVDETDKVMQHNERRAAPKQTETRPSSKVENQKGSSKEGME